ncbi:MAG TPA: hydantoinase/oxoprolinase family protein [Thermoanaerobaculia bacterium]|nr:hydantoinase/oxoprolinase family protein [Thermoanaerobaculia bacterium]
MSPPPWRLWVDTGGTFTDCVAVDPAGRTHRLKVLSSSALRGRLEEQVEEKAWRIQAAWAASAPVDLFRGYGFRLLGGSAAVSIRSSSPDGPSLHLDGSAVSSLPEVPSARAAFELLSPEEAPVLAARLLTGTPLDRPLPPIAMRLATTRGTNALLERKGAKTALFVTRGFADLLEIGTQQRPDLFALDIRKPPPLHATAIEVSERLAADGTVLVPLDLAALEEEAARLLADGFEAAAVALLHSYRAPRHEEALADWLAARGFRHVAHSAALAPRIQLLPRATTAVVDAYLAPAIGEYLERVAAALPGGTLHVLTSAGALAGTATFRPKDSLLSGPAGGVLGAALAGRRSALPRIIAFDVGGTSTDVARWDGAFEVVFEHRVGDAWLVAPALAIESVAAGGGSICRFDGTQLKVGPESAGAAPGPACYGAGGPLTLTDVNLLLGRLDPRRFGIPLVVEAAERAFAALAEAVRQAEGDGGEAPPREALLAGLLAIADERTADAIRTISVRRGIDPADYALVAFGGAGGQHACAVAELLGIGTVLVPADAGLLSALGLGAAAVERFAQRQVLEPLAAAVEGLPALLAELEEEARAAVAAEGVVREEIAVTRRLLHLRFLGQDATVAVEHDPAVPVEGAFAAAYRALFGYAPEGRGVELESVHVAAASRPAEPEPPLPEPALFDAPAPATRRAWFDGWREVPAYDREALAAGTRFAGPALVFEAHATTVVPAGWSARIDGAGGLLIARRPKDS